MKLRNGLIVLIKLALFNLITVQAIAADEGKKVYLQMCASCHGPDGNGVGAGAFPPLKESEWLKGEPVSSQRIAQILLHGLTGPIEVKGKQYNLVMPVQGALSDEQKVSVIRYVRKEFGGEKTAFSLKDLEKIKKLSSNRTEAWTAKELLQLYPLPKPKPAISNLIMTVYHGGWTKMPDFSKLEGATEEEEHHGYLSLKNITRKDQYALVWNGDLKVEEDGVYEFELMADDGAAVFINGQKIAQVKGLGAMTAKRTRKGKMPLKQGDHKIKVQYFEYLGGEGISLRMRNLQSKQRHWQWLSEKRSKAKKLPPVMIDITPKGENTRMYLNFIAGSTNRTMGVGFPHGQNMAFSLSDCQPDLIWKGKFINAGKHWTNRGQGAQVPLSSQVVKLGKGSAWSIDGKTIEVQLVGYTMDKKSNPTFHYKSKASGLTFSEKYTSSINSLTREITINSEAAQAITLRLAEGTITLRNAVAVIQDLAIQVPDILLKDGQCSVPMQLQKGTNSYTIQYSWLK